jgi:hypothetical protein
MGNSVEWLLCTAMDCYCSGVELGLVLKWYTVLLLFCCVIALFGLAWGWQLSIESLVRCALCTPRYSPWTSSARFLSTRSSHPSVAPY